MASRVTSLFEWGFGMTVGVLSFVKLKVRGVLAVFEVDISTILHGRFWGGEEDELKQVECQ